MFDRHFVIIDIFVQSMEFIKTLQNISHKRLLLRI